MENLTVILCLRKIRLQLVQVFVFFLAHVGAGDGSGER